MDQTVTQQIAAARAYLADFLAASPGPFEGSRSRGLAASLAGMIEILDSLYLEDPQPESEQARRRDALLAEVPASQRAAGDPAGDRASAVASVLAALPGDDILAVTRWLRAARAEGPAAQAAGAPPMVTTATLTEALQAVREAVDIPLPATVGDSEVYDRILLERLTHVRLMLRTVLDPDREPDVAWQAGYLRERLAEVPAEGYRTWAEAVAERKAAEGDAQ